MMTNIIAMELSAKAINPENHAGLVWSFVLE
jgi:hypothetical protein